MVDKI